LKISIYIKGTVKKNEKLESHLLNYTCQITVDFSKTVPISSSYPFKTFDLMNMHGKRFIASDSKTEMDNI
jgi:hypothetical protein